MRASADPRVADPDAPAAPPHANGELVFEEPWESRVFGVAVALHDAGIVDFERFRTRLIDEIRTWELDHGHRAPGYHYYERWLAALERTLLAEGVVEPNALAAAQHTIEHAWAHDHD